MLSIVSSAIAETTHVAVLNFTGAKVDEAVLNKLSDQSRTAAVMVLPHPSYVIMTRENVALILHDMGKDVSCIAGQCEVELGRNIGADVIVTGDMLNMDSTHVLTLKLYDTHTGGLLYSLDVEAIDLLDLKRQTLEQSKVLFTKGLKLSNEKAQGRPLEVTEQLLPMSSQQSFSLTEVYESNERSQQMDILEQEIVQHLDMKEAAIQLKATEQWNSVAFHQLRENTPYGAVESVVRFIEAYQNVVVEYPLTEQSPIRISPIRTVDIPETATAEQWLRDTFSSTFTVCGYTPRQCTLLGYDYSTGTDGKVENRARALELFAFSCDSGYALGCARLGHMYEKGHGTAIDLRTASTLYTQACYGGNGLGCNNLAELYKNGSGVPKNLAQSAKLYRDACGFGYVRGCVHLGRMYQKGLGVPQDTTRAAELYQQGCENGSQKGCKWLKTLD